eukprot:1267076-Ditylum_brightwellii.AAC.1
MDEMDDYYKFQTIVDHEFKNRILLLRVKYYNEKKDQENMLKTLFDILKKILMDLAWYIKRHIVEKSRRNSMYNVWATKTLKANVRTTRRMNWIRDIGRAFWVAIRNRTGRA